MEIADQPVAPEGAEPEEGEENQKGAEQAKPPRRRAAAKRAQRGKRRGPVEKRRGQRAKRRGLEEKREGVTVKTAWSGGGGKRRWDKKHYCVFCRRPQVKIARHMLRKHADEQEVVAASALPPGSKQRHLLLEHLRCRGNYLHNIEVIRQGSGEIVPSRQPSEEVDARNYLPCPLCLGFFLRADLWKHQVSCRKKLSNDKSPEDPSGTKRPPDPGADRNAASEPGTNRPRKRARVQAAASRLLPISSGASESCSQILHRMNLDNVSYQVKSDWLICRYGNRLMGNQDGGGDQNQDGGGGDNQGGGGGDQGGGGGKRYDYVSQKLRELGRLLLAAKSLDPGVRTLQDLLAPGRLGLALSAARKASGFRWSRPPLAVKTTLRTVCEIAIGENLQDGDWEAAAKTTDFYHMLGREWDNLGLQGPGPDTDPDGRETLKKRTDQTRTEKDLQSEVLTKTSSRPVPPLVLPDSRLQTPVSVPMAPKKVQRRPWSTAEKEAVWRQLGVHVLVQTVPGKEVCQRCLDLEPVLRGRHWKDVKNQVHNQIQSQKKQQFHAQMDLEENRVQPDQVQNQNQKKQPKQVQVDLQAKDHQQNQERPQYQAPHMDQHDSENSQNLKRSQYQAPHMDQPQPENLPNQKRPQYQIQMNQKKQQDPPRLDHQDHQVLKKQLYLLDPQPLQNLDRENPLVPAPPFGPPLLEREPVLGPYPVLHRAPGPHMDPWPQDHLTPNYQLSRQLDRNLVPDPSSGGPPPDSHPRHVHF